METAPKLLSERGAPLDLRTIVRTDGAEPGVRLLFKLTQVLATNHATDLYVREGLPLAFRAKGVLQYAVGSGVGEKGIVPPADFTALCGYLEKASERDLAETIVVLVGDHQLRFEHSPYVRPRELLVRVQPIAPYNVDDYLGRFPQTKKFLSQASGLVLICGPMNAGKTSLLASIAAMLAKDGGGQNGSRRHVMMVGDPVEYSVSPIDTIVSQVECALTGPATNKRKPDLSEIMPYILRSDINLLTIGEIRQPEALESAMRFSSGHVPVLATIHASGIADCIVRTLSLAEKTCSPNTARLVLSSSLEGVFFINIAHTEEGRPVPVVEFLTMQSLAIRNAIADASPRELVARINSELQNGRNEYYITRRQALTTAVERGLPEAEAKRKLGRIVGEE